MAILDAAGNGYFRRAVVPVWSVVERATVGILHLPGVFETAWVEHDQIAKALRAGDADLADSRLRLHMQNAVDQLVEALPGAGS